MVGLVSCRFQWSPHRCWVGVHIDHYEAMLSMNREYYVVYINPLPCVTIRLVWRR